MRGEAEPAPQSVVPAKFLGGVLAIGAGLALGREGPTVQMGSVIGSTLGRWLHLPVEDIRPLQATAAGADLAVAFNAPLGGALFVLEEVARYALLPGLGIASTGFAIAGMAAFFVGVVRSPFTGIALVVEMTATTSLLAPLLIASFGALLVATLLGGKPIYDTLRERMLLAGVPATTAPMSGRPAPVDKADE